MTGRRALFIGGGGPTGKPIVDGLIERGYEVSVLNSGRRPMEFRGEVERIAADPHFAESLEGAIAGRDFDLVFAQYGRVRMIADVMAGRTERFIALGGMFYPGWIDPAATTRPTSETGEQKDWSVQYFDGAESVAENVPLEEVGGLGAKVVETDRALRWHHLRGHFSVTLLRYPRVYGPRQPGAAEWSIVRRLLEGRTRIILPEAGLAAHSILFSENAARIALACVDQPSVADGAVLNCADRDPVTVRRWVRWIAEAMGRPDVELVSVPTALAVPSWPYARFPTTTGHHILDTSALDALGVQLIPTRTGLTRTVHWLVADTTRGSAVEPQLADAFNYAQEDAVLAAMDRARDEIADLRIIPGDMAHPYAHPATPSST